MGPSQWFPWFLDHTHHSHTHCSETVPAEIWPRPIGWSCSSVVRGFVLERAAVCVCVCVCVYMHTWKSKAYGYATEFLWHYVWQKHVYKYTGIIIHKHVYIYITIHAAVHGCYINLSTSRLSWIMTNPSHNLQLRERGKSGNLCYSIQVHIDMYIPTCVIQIHVDS